MYKPISVRSSSKITSKIESIFAIESALATSIGLDAPIDGFALTVNSNGEISGVPVLEPASVKLRLIWKSENAAEIIEKLSNLGYLVELESEETWREALVRHFAHGMHRLASFGRNLLSENYALRRDYQDLLSNFERVERDIYLSGVTTDRVEFEMPPSSEGYIIRTERSCVEQLIPASGAGFSGVAVFLEPQPGLKSLSIEICRISDSSVIYSRVYSSKTVQTGWNAFYLDRSLSYSGEKFILRMQFIGMSGRPSCRIGLSNRTGHTDYAVKIDGKWMERSIAIRSMRSFPGIARSGGEADGYQVTYHRNLIAGFIPVYPYGKIKAFVDNDKFEVKIPDSEKFLVFVINLQKIGVDFSNPSLASIDIAYRSQNADGSVRIQAQLVTADELKENLGTIKAQLQRSASELRSGWRTSIAADHYCTRDRSMLLIAVIKGPVEDKAESSLELRALSVLRAA